MYVILLAYFSDQIKSYFTALSVDTEGDDSYFGNIKRHLQVSE